MRDLSALPHGGAGRARRAVRRLRARASTLYNSCRNRHCPKCQAGCRGPPGWSARPGTCCRWSTTTWCSPCRRRWPSWRRRNPRLIYDLLFEAAAQTVREVAADPKHLGAQVGLTAVLHTWGQTLQPHPHVHGMATGGGLSCDARGEIDESAGGCRAGRASSCRCGCSAALFRGKFLAGLREACEQGEVHAGRATRCATRTARSAWLAALQTEQDWVVYASRRSAGRSWC